MQTHKTVVHGKIKYVAAVETGEFYSTGRPILKRFYHARRNEAVAKANEFLKNKGTKKDVPYGSNGYTINDAYSKLESDWDVRVSDNQDDPDTGFTEKSADRNKDNAKALFKILGNPTFKDLNKEESLLALEKGKIDLEELKKKIAIGDFTMNDLLKQYKILRDDGYAMIATGFNSSTGNFILPSAKPNLIRDVQQNAFASIMKNVQRENIGNLLNSKVVSNFISLANNIPAIGAGQGVTPEFGKVYVNRDGSKFIYLGPGVLKNANQEDIKNIPIPR